MRDVAIIGVGIHKFGRFDDKPWQQIGLEATTMALEDANVPWQNIGAAYCAKMYLPSSAGNKILTRLGRTGIPIVDIEAACASGGVALRHAYVAVASGMCDYALALGVEKMPRGFMDPTQIYEDWEINMGLSTNPSYWAMRARRHMASYGTTDLQIAKVAYKNHRNGVKNPYAMYQTEFPLEEIMNSRLVCSPIRLLEICSPDEGAAAAIVCSMDKAREHTSRPIQLASCEHRVSLYASFVNAPAYQNSAKVSNPPPTTMAARAAYERAGVGPEDIDLAEVQDTDAFCEIESVEQLGLCQLGEGGKLVDDGVTEPTGRLPVNVSGGLICKGEPVGASHLGQIVEMTWQLRGQAGPRQVAKAKVGLCHVVGAGGNSCVTILKS